MAEPATHAGTASPVVERSELFARALRDCGIATLEDALDAAIQLFGANFYEILESDLSDDELKQSLQRMDRTYTQVLNVTAGCDSFAEVMLVLLMAQRDVLDTAMSLYGETAGGETPEPEAPHEVPVE